MAWVTHLCKRLDTFVHQTQFEYAHFTSCKAIVLHMEHNHTITNTDVSRDNQPNQSRFKATLFVLLLKGIPLNKSLSKLVTVYNMIAVMCVYFNFLCIIMDTFVHRHDLVQAMKKLRIVLGLSLVIWIHFSHRYDITILKFRYNLQFSKFTIVLRFRR
jgi:hypothetical protein